MTDTIRDALANASAIDDDDPVLEDEEFAPQRVGEAEADGRAPRLPSGRVIDEATLALIRANAAEPPTDIGNGRRMLTMHGRDMLYVPNLGWFLYDDTRWKPCDSLDPVRILAHRTAETIEFEARFFAPSKAQIATMEAADQAREMIAPLARKAHSKGEKLSPEEQVQHMSLQAAIEEGAAVRERLAKGREARRKYARSSQNKNKLTAMIEEARPYIATDVDALDPDPMALNVGNGSLRFEQDQSSGLWVAALRPHDRAQMHTKIASAAYHETAECPRFLNFLERIVPDDGTRDFLKRWFGYTLTGMTREQKFVFFYGEGANGKSTLVDTVARILGEYCVTVPFATLAGDDKRRGDSATPDLVRLPGARMVRAAEPEKGVRLKEAEIKALTGGEAVLIRRMREEFVEIEPEFKLVLSGNHEPMIHGNDHGIWRRTLLVPFTQQIPSSEVDMGLPARLMEERDGILAWMVAGTLEYLERGLDPPDEVLAATAAYRESQDPITNFVQAAFEFPQGDEVEDAWHTPRDLYATYLRWCEQASERPFAQKKFSSDINKMLPKLGATRIKRNGIYVQKGFRIAPFFRATDGADGAQDRDLPQHDPGDDVPFD